MSKGYDVTVVCDRLDRDAWEKFAGLRSRPGLAKNVRVAWSTGRSQVILLLVPMMVRVLLNARGTFWRTVREGWKRFGWDVARKLYLAAQVIFSRPHLVHFEFGTLAAARIYVGRMLECKTVVSFRGYDLNYVGLDRGDYYAEVWREADAIHTLGGDLWARAIRRGCPGDKIHALVTPAIDTDFFEPRTSRAAEAAGDSGRPLRLLSVGRLEWKKGYEHVLAAVARLRDLGVKAELRIVGGGDYLEAVAFCRHQLGLEDCVNLLGPAPAEEVRKHLEWADVFVHGAVSEGFCNAVIEAQAMRVPVVTSDADGLGENVEDGITGFLTPRRDPAAMAERLALLARDPDLRLRMGAAGRDRVLRSYRLPDQIDAFDRLYRQVLGVEVENR